MERHSLMKIFLDSSVLIAAAGSKTGASALVLGYCRQQKIQGYISDYVLAEAKRNVWKKFPVAARERLKQFLLKANLQVVKTMLSEKDITTASQYIHEKDAPILALAKNLEVDTLLSLDKHFFAPEAFEYAKPIQIMRPGDFVMTQESTAERNGATGQI